MNLATILQWISLNAIALANMIGIAMDIFGAYFVAYEVVRRYRGEKYESGIGSGPIGGVPTNDAPIETLDFQAFERRRFRNMTLGMALLTVGFTLQFLANAAQLKNAP